MIFIPGPLVAALTFPGVIMHEVAHRFMCDILRVPVYGINYFSIDSARAGYVYHQRTNNTLHVFLISFAPLFINSFFCMIFTLPYMSTVHIAGEGINNFANGFLWWIGMSMGINAFPSNQDTDNVLSVAEENNSSFIVLLLCYLMKLMNWLSYVWMDLVYAYGLSFILPYCIFK